MDKHIKKNKRIWLIGFLALLLTLISILPVFACRPEKTVDIRTITSYRQIPGVTQAEIDAIEAVKSQRESFIYGQMHETEAFLTPDGYAGFTIKLCALFSQLFGIEFKFEEFRDFVPLLNRLEPDSPNPVDFTGDLTYTEKRVTEGGFFMSHAIAERSFRLYYHKDSDDILNEKQLEGLKVGFYESTIDKDLAIAFYPTLEQYMVQVKDLDEVIQQLNDNQADKSTGIDVFITEGVLDPLFSEYPQIKSKEFLPLIYTPVSLTTKTPSLAPFITVVDKYLEAGGIDKLYDLYKEGDFEYAKYKLEKSLGESEKEYLSDLRAGRKKITAGFEYDNYPVSFYNSKEKQFQGIAVDVLDKICEILGISYEISNTKTTPWANVMDMLESGEIDMTAQLLKTQERIDSGMFLWSDNALPYATANYALISRSEYPEIANYQVLRSKVAVVKQSAHEDMYDKWFPGNANKLVFNSQSEAFAALEKGDADLLMGSDYMLLMETNYLEKSGFKINIRFNEPMDSYFGFNKDCHELRAIIGKAQEYVKTAQIEGSWTGRVFDYTKKMANQRSMYLLVVAAVSFLAAVLTVYFVYKNNKRKSAEHAAQGASLAKSAFLARMSHEIRTPLNAIIGMANIAESSIDNREKSLAAVRQITSSSQHLLGVLNDVLDMSKIESGKLELISEPFNLASAVCGVSDIISQRCNEKDVAFVTNISEFENVFVNGDRLRLNQVLINLLGNAVKFTAKNGEVKLLLKKLFEDDLKIKIKFSICDNGIGMSEQQISKLFVAFEQADSTIAARFGGTGLGLSISQNLINMMGSVIKVQSMPDKGSTFEFELDFDKSAPISDDEADTDCPDLSGKRILVAEDIEINRFILAEILSTTGAELDDAANGEIAVSMFKASAPGYYSLIFMDIQMPVMNGYEASVAIRRLARPDAATVPIVAMTANAYKEDVDNAIAAGMNDHLSKPIDIAAIFKTLNRFLGK